MHRFDETIGRLAWTQLWQVTLVVLAAGLVARLACRRRPHLAYLVWLVVLAKCLTPPLWSSPTSLFSWTSTSRDGALEADRVAAPPTVAAPGEVRLATIDRVEMAEPEQSIADGAEWSSGSAVAEDQPAAGATPSRAARAMHSLARVLFDVWLIAAVVQLAVALAALIRWRRTIRREQMVVNGQLVALVDALARRLGIGRPVRLIVTRQPLGPVTYGWLRPTIVLPEALVAARSTGELEPLVAHELIHVRRGDTLVGLVQLLAQALWWFYPPVRWANQQLALERERSCDEEVIAALGLPAARYVAGLLGVLELKLSLRIPLALPGVRRSEITRQRLEHLISHPGSFERRTPRRYWLLVAAAVLLLLPGAGLSGSAEPEEKKPPASGQAGEGAAQDDAPKAAAAATQADRPATDARARVLRLSDVQQLAGSEPGSAVLSFRVDEPAGTQFQIEYRQWGVRGAFGTGTILTVDGESAVVRLTISYLPAFAGDRKTNVLDSREEQLVYRVEATGAGPSGVSTFVSAPLWNVPVEQRLMKLIRQDDDAWAATKLGGRRILLVCRKDQAGQDAEPLKPRAEIAVYRPDTQTQSSAPSLRARLANTWSRQKSEIGSAQIQYHLVRASDSLLAPLSRDEVDKILAAADLAKHPESYAAVATQLMLPEKLKEIEFKPAAHRFFSAGLNWRDEGEREIAICDGESELRYDKLNDQLDVYARNASHVAHTSNGSFRIFFDLGPPSLFQIETQPDGKVRLTNTTGDNHTEWILDAENGFVESVIGGTPKRETDRFQYGPVRYPGGIVMPTLKVETRYEDGALSFLEMWKIDEAQFNDGLPPGIFQMAAPAGTKVYIHGGDPAKPPKYVMIQKPTADLAQFLRGRPDLMPEWLINWPVDRSVEREDR